MAITYDVTLATDLSKLRRAIGDVTDGSGPLPTGANFTDAELESFMSEEGSWQKAVAYACETLGNAWAIAVTFKADGVSVNRSDVSKAWLDMAQKWRAKYGGLWRSGAAAVTRADGYSDDVTNIEV